MPCGDGRVRAGGVDERVEIAVPDSSRRRDRASTVAPNRACLRSRRDSSGSVTTISDGAVGAGELHDHDADRSGTGDEHAATRRRCLALRTRGDADRQRLAQRGGVVGHGVRHRMGELPRRWSRSRTARRRPAGSRRSACAGTGCSRRGGSPRCRGRAAGVRSTPVDRCATGRPIRRRRRSSPPLRGRAPTAPRRRSCRSGRGGSSACPTRRRPPTTPGSARHPAPGVGTGRCCISIRPGSTSTAARIRVSGESVVCVTFAMLA